MDKLKICSDHSDEEEEAEAGEDERISTLYAFADKHTPKEYVEKLDELGTDSAIVLGGMCASASLDRIDLWARPRHVCCIVPHTPG